LKLFLVTSLKCLEIQLLLKKIAYYVDYDQNQCNIYSCKWKMIHYIVFIKQLIYIFFQFE